MGNQLMFSVDLSKCINCKTCEMACNEYHGLTEVNRRTVFSYDKENTLPIHISISCNHCANPVCVSICPENNFEKRGDGIVIHHAGRCEGCQRCVSACPFHAPKLNPKTNRADKCNFCVERLDQGLKPVCVENCITTSLGVIMVSKNERRAYAFCDSDIPLMEYTNPSIFVKKKEKGHIFLREE